MELIGKGRTAEVYEYDSDKVIKLFYKSFPDNVIIHEYNIGLALNKLNVNSPFCYEMINYEDRKGIIYHKIKGNSLLDKMISSPFQIIKYSILLANINHDIHKKTTKELPDLYNHFYNAITKSKDILGNYYDPIIDLLKNMDDGYNICHGDLHPENIMINNQDIFIIDWTNSYYGNSLSDIARSYIMIMSPSLPDNISLLSKIFIIIFRFIFGMIYLRTSITLSGTSKKDIEEWFPIIAAARISENVPGEKKWLLKLIKKHLRGSI